ncbi:hypothetical protein CRG98_032345 [Punica granatum]|uniref:Uncharacterized protein n=1 Tax=Punica granatum TaxID=22663 RepID=A0A2I0ITD1_PUNGR|nr:hypothetical protein CRG98_032345 [Punica granatum]
MAASLDPQGGSTDGDLENGGHHGEAAIEMAKAIGDVVNSTTDITVGCCAMAEMVAAVVVAGETLN